MSKPGAKKLLLLAVITVLGVNTLLLSKVWLNRSKVLAELPLSERELRLPYQYGFAKEDSALRLSLQWSTPLPQPETEEWQYLYQHQQRLLPLTEPHFASFGFASCDHGYRRQQRQAWALLEFNGQSYQHYLSQVAQYYAALQQQLAAEASAELTVAAAAEAAAKRRHETQQRAAELLRFATEEATRLFVIDAAADHRLLQQELTKRSGQTAGQLLIVAADIQLSYRRCQHGRPEAQPEVMVSRLAVESLYVPKSLRQGLWQAPTGTQKIRFQAQLRYGRYAEPWLSALTLSGTEP